MPKVHYVKKARKAHGNGIEKGDAYYWWEFRYGGIRKSKTYPTRSQLTQSSFLSQIYAIEDNLSQYDSEDAVQDLISELETLRDECQDSLDNMPEALQDTSEAGITLQERIDGLDEWINELQGIDFEALEQEAHELHETFSDSIVEAVSNANSSPAW